MGFNSGFKELNEHFEIPSPEAAKIEMHNFTIWETCVVLHLWMFGFHTTPPFIYYKFSPLTCSSFAKFTLSYAIDKQSELSHRGVVHQPSQPFTLCIVLATFCVLTVLFVCSSKKFFKTEKRTMPTCSHSSDVFPLSILTHMPPSFPHCPEVYFFVS